MSTLTPPALPRRSLQHLPRHLSHLTSLCKQTLRWQRWLYTTHITIATHLRQQSANWACPPPSFSFSSYTFLSHKHRLNRCPVGLNFSPFLPLIFDAPCIALIMYLASAQTSAVSNTFECLKRQTHHRGAWRLVAGGISIHYISPICTT